MEFITPYTISAAIAVYFFLILSLYGFNIAQYLLLFSAVWFGMCVIVETVARKLQLSGLENVMWFAPGLCGCVLTGGVIYRAVQVYKYLKNETRKQLSSLNLLN
ncbi:hypothetical protein F384_26185 (plasmid) [Citrobacter amalonaticus Y19]|uniref:Uncharacterized protein n=1 Tax=Citrobacter amalonaticus Y19 TaxID=1261127 RepID=A0A0F6U039_CITAM|nr:hypothetical protein [Citrobacter amalonaticus]AKE62066.1 hypothetical protein F384_26185 [Citrobacter amalonaticus Y19]